MRKKTIGKLSFGPTVDITDPCYDRDVWCRMNKVSIKQGSYTCVVWSEDGRVGIIGIYLDGKIPKQSAMKTIGEIGVDAGLAGFFLINRILTMLHGIISAKISEMKMCGLPKTDFFLPAVTEMAAILFIQNKAKAKMLP